MANTSHPRRSLAAEFHETWWSLALRGIAALIFGAFCWAAYEPSLWTLSWAFALYAVVDGVLAFMAAGVGAKEHQPWLLLLIWGAIGVTAGILAWVAPAASTTALAIYVAAFAGAKGIVELVLAGRLRGDAGGTTMLAVMGVVSLALAALLVVRASADEFATLWSLALYGLVWGALCIGMGFEARTYVTIERRHTPRHQLRHR